MRAVPKPKGSTNEIVQLGTSLLQVLSLDEMRAICKRLTQKKAPTKKAEAAEKIAEFLLLNGLKDTFDGLSDLEKLAVGEALHSEDGYVPSKFAAMYGREINFGSSSYNSEPKVIRIFLEFRIGGSYVVSQHLRQRLLEFVPEPKKATVKVTEVLPLTYKRKLQRGLRYVSKAESEAWAKEDPSPISIIERSEHAQTELFAVLRLIQQRRVVVSPGTCMPSPDNLAKIAHNIGGDYYTDLDLVHFAEIGYIRCFAWIKLVQESGLAVANGKYLELTKGGVAALSMKPSAVLIEIWQKWQKSKFDEFARVDLIKGQGSKGKRNMTSVVGRREQILNTLKDCPADKWIQFEDFSRYMRACNNTFEVTYDPRSLYVSDPKYGSLGYDGNHDWESLQDRYLMCFLFEYAATLGLIDIAYVPPRVGARDFAIHWGLDREPFLSRYDGLLYFRVNHLGEYLLGLSPAFKSSCHSNSAELTVFPNLQVRLKSGKLSAESLLMLESFCDAIADDAWEISSPKAIAACENGIKVSEMRELLLRFDDQPLPERVEALLSKVEKQFDALSDGGIASLYSCRSAKVAEAVSSHNQMKGLCRMLDEKTLVVKPRDVEKFRKALRIIGYGVGSLK